MCGIVGYVGQSRASPILLDALQRLEYRGYDSAGLCTVAEGALRVCKSVGRVARLREQLDGDPLPGTIGIAHTRWATHGAPSIANAHPQIDTSGRFALVHNGVIENYASLRAYLERQGIEFASETDTETLVQLIAFRYSECGDFLESVRAAVRDVTGSLGIAVLCADSPETLIAARRGSPLLVGIGNGELLLGSDASAIVRRTSQVTYLDDHEIAVIGPAGLQVSTFNATPVVKGIGTIEFSLEEIELGNFEHHMLKEIYEQPTSLRNTMRGRVDSLSGKILLEGLAHCQRDLARQRRALLFGCGTAWHAALIGEYLIEEFAQMPCKVEYASELRYRNPLIEEDTLAIVISQSGETADSLAALHEVQTRGAFAIGVVNVVGSSIARATDAGVYLHVGPEVGVASTKAFTAQVAVLTMLAAFLGRRRHLDQDRVQDVLDGLAEIPEQVEEALQLDSQVRMLAGRLVEWENWLYLGRGVNYPVALEGALKLKEISYIHAEGMPAAEMKHGPIAMIEPGMPVVFVAPRDRSYDKVLSNMEEVRSRGGTVIVVATSQDSALERVADEVLYVPVTPPMLSPLVTTIPLQLLAYHAAVLRGHDVDKPRNLAKSVTVE